MTLIYIMACAVAVWKATGRPSIALAVFFFLLSIVSAIKKALKVPTSAQRIR